MASDQRTVPNLDCDKASRGGLIEAEAEPWEAIDGKLLSNL